MACGQVRKVAERKFPEFFEFSARILHRMLLRIFPEFFEDFSCFVSWETGTEKNHQKSPPFFNAKFPGKHAKNIRKILLESRQSNMWGLGFQNVLRFPKFSFFSGKKTLSAFQHSGAAGFSSTGKRCLPTSRQHHALEDTTLRWQV